MSWAKGIAGPEFIGYLIDLVCEKLNFLFDGNFRDANLDKTQVTELASAIAAPMSMMVSNSGCDIDKQLEKLYESLPLLQADENSNYSKLSKNLTRKEIACKCGCGFDIVDYKLVETFQAIRDYIDKPIHINSGCRCPERNEEAGGAKESAHMEGMALDMYVSGLSSRQFGDIVKKVYREGKIPHLRYCYLITGKTNTAIHVGVDEKQRSGIWGW
jgi:uncharacterized protein YcbK (DUF882 family)